MNTRAVTKLHDQRSAPVWIRQNPRHASVTRNTLQTRCQTPRLFQNFFTHLEPPYATSAHNQRRCRHGWEVMLNSP